MIWTLVRVLHLLAMAFFVGGQLMLVAVVVPVELRAPDRERLKGRYPSGGPTARRSQKSSNGEPAKGAGTTGIASADGTARRRKV